MKKTFTYSIHVIGLMLLFMATNYTISQTGPAGVGSSTDNKVWLDAHSLGFPDGSSVASWADLSGNGSNFTQGASIRQPIYNTSGIGSRPSLTFDGVNDVMVSGPLADMETPNITYFIVYDRTTTTSDMMINADYDSDWKKWRTYMNNGQNFIISAHFSPSIRWARYTDPPGASFFSSHITPSNLRLYNQGTLEFTRTNAYTVPTGHNDIYLGNRTPTTTSLYTFTGEMSEVIIFNDALNDLERIMVENYLGAKYGMAIPTDHYAYDGTHEFGLIGIGDDGTNTQTVAQGAGILELSGAADLASDEYFLVAHTDFSPTTYNLDNLPAALPAHQRLERTWRVGETGDVGTTTLTFNISGELDFAVSDSYRLLIDDDGDFTDATTVAGTYDGGAGTITFTTNLDDGDYFTLSGILEILEIHSITDGDWSVEETWDCTCIPGANDLVFIDPSTTVTVDIDGFTDDLTVEFLGTLVMDTDVTLDINGDWDILGLTDITDGTVSLTGDVPQDVTIISTAAVVVNLNNLFIENTSPGNVTFLEKFFTVNGTMSPNRGNIVIDPSTTFTIASTSATEGGRIGPIVSPTTITGEIIAERFIPAGPADWRNLCSPVIGSTFDDWDPDLAMSGEGFPDGCAFGPDGCFRSVTYTDHSIFTEVVNSTDPILNTRGFEIFVGDDLETFSGTTLRSRGTLNTSSDLVKSYTTGWTILGNPYVSPIAFSSIDRDASIGNYFYVYDPASGSYEWYDGASGTSSLVEITEDGLIATGQAVWVFASSVGDMTFNQFDKVESTATYIRTPVEDNGLHVTLRENNSTFSCTMHLEENPAALDGTDDEMDIRHLSTGNEKGPSLAVLSNGDLLRKNLIKSDGRDKSFELHSKILNDGFYTISADNWANFGSYHKILLYDKITGETVNLKEHEYVFFASKDDADKKKFDARFTLILSNSAEANDNTSIFANQTNESDQIKITQMGNIIDVQSAQEFDEQTTITVTNVLGQKEVFLTTTTLVAGSNIVTLPESLKGFHIITLKTGENRVTQKIVL